MEGQFETEKGAPLRIGGIPDEEKRETPYAIEIPYALSFLAFADPNAEVKGLNDFPKDDTSARCHRPFCVSNNGRVRFDDGRGCRFGERGVGGVCGKINRNFGLIPNGFCGRWSSPRRSDLLRLKRVGLSRKSDGSRG